MRRAGATIAIGLAVIVLIGAYNRLSGSNPSPRFQTAAVSAGDVVRRVAATGSLEAVTTAQVGSQVSGTVSALYADFNSIVRKGQVIARLDPSLLDAQIESARSALAKATADVDAAKVAESDARVKLDRARALHEKQLLPDADLDAARVALETMTADLAARTSQEKQARAALNQALVTRRHTIIASPIDGIVVARDVEVGQTVAASFQAPTLFVIADDLSQMQLNASVDESDIGAVQPGQDVTFTVDAYPQEEFHGVVKQVRLQPVVTQNVVTYTTIIAVDNSDLRLKPGMTATLNIEVARATGVLRVPARALRYVPRKEMFVQMGQPVPAALAEETARRSGSGPAARGFVWVLENDTLRPVRVSLGLSDANFAEVKNGDLHDGMPLAVGEVVAPTRAVAPTPLAPTPRFRGRG